jgi:PAS domain S-box-containing protein
VDYRTLAENSLQGIAIFQNNRLVYANPANCRIFGYTLDEFLAMSMEQIVALTHPEDMPAAIERIRRRERGERVSFNNELRIIRKDGSTGWIQNFNSEIEYNGQPAILATNIDLAEQKRAELEHNRRVSELEALYDGGLLISQLLEPKQIAQKMVDILSNKLNWHHAAVRLYHPRDNRMELLALSQPGLSEEEIEENINRLNEMLSRVDRGLSGWVIRNRQAVRSGNLPADPRYIASYTGMLSGLYVPLQIGNDVFGSIAVETEEKDAFSEQDERLLVTLASQAAITIRNAQLYLQTQKELEERRLVEEKIRQLNIELERRVEERTIEIETTRQRLELATTSGGIGVWELNFKTNGIFWDDRMYAIHGLEADKVNLSNEYWWTLLHPEDLVHAKAVYQNAIETGNKYIDEYRVVLPDGSIRHISGNGVVLYDENRKAERMVGVNIDVTRQREAEQALHGSETYARLLFDAAPEPVYVSEANGVIVDANRLFELQHAIVIDEMRGRHISELGIFPKDELQKAQKYVTAVINGQTVPPVELDFHFQDGTTHTLEMNSYLIEVRGRPLVLSTTRDITVHKKGEETLRLANAEMERALRIKDEFLASMSHELRTPLNAILGISESLEEQIIGPLNEKQLKYLRTINESGRHLHELINDILDLSKIEAGRMDLTILDVNAAHLCESSMRMVKELAQKKGLTFSSFIDPQVKTIKGDERRLKQTLVNLLSNAVKFTPPGNEIGIQLQGRPETSEATFTVWDHGIGIAQQDTDRLFKPFVQLDSSLSREYAGTGLGLALVAQMVRLHGGSVSVESELGKGSRFNVTLPWVPEENNQEAQIALEDDGPAPRSEGKRSGRVLIVEDTHTVASLMKEYLEAKGYEVYTASNGMEGVTLAKKKLPDVILMDVMMPVMDGMEATRQIRTEKTLEQVPIIALTALAMPGDRERCFAAGMNDYLSKPIHFKELLKVMDRHALSMKSDRA